MFGVGLAISIPLIIVAFAVDNVGLLIKRTATSLITWKTSSQRRLTRQGLFRLRTSEENDDDDDKQLENRSEETHRDRYSFEAESGSHYGASSPRRSSGRWRHRSRKHGPDWRDGRTGSGDLERAVGVG